MKNKIVPIILSVFGFISLFLLLFTASNALNRIPSVTQINYNKSSDIKPFTVSKAVETDKRINEIYVGEPTLSFCAEAKETEVRENSVTPVLVNERFFNNYKIDAGNFQKNSAVISKDLALKLYLNTNAVGKPLELFGKTYKVSAVYDRSDGLCYDGKERVYIPYNSVKNYESFEVSEFACKNGSQSAVAFTQMRLENYYYTNLAEKKNVINDFIKLSILILYFVFLAFALKLRKYLCKKSKAKINDSLETNYALRSVKKSLKSYVVYYLSFFGIPALLIALFIFGNFGIYIIPSYIPYNNIFDIPYYLEQLTKSVNEFNQTALVGNLFYIRLYHETFNSLVHQILIFLALSLSATVSWFISFRNVD